MPLFDVVVIGGIFLAGLSIVAFTVRSMAIAGVRYRSSASVPGGSGEALQTLEERVEQLQQRVAELEERQDFAERVLAQVRDQGRLPGPQGR